MAVVSQQWYVRLQGAKSLAGFKLCTYVQVCRQQEKLRFFVCCEKSQQIWYESVLALPIYTQSQRSQSLNKSLLSKGPSDIREIALYFKFHHFMPSLN